MEAQRMGNKVAAAGGKNSCLRPTWPSAVSAEAGTALISQHCREPQTVLFLDRHHLPCLTRAPT